MQGYNCFSLHNYKRKKGRYYPSFLFKKLTVGKSFVVLIAFSITLLISAAKF